MSDVRIAILTTTDAVAHAEADEAGRSLIDACEERGWLVVAYHVCPDDIECISTSLLEMTDMEGADIVLTSGGTGIGPREVTPEATTRIVEREVPGLADLVREACRTDDDMCALSRGVAGIRGRSLIVNLPGGAGGAMTAFGRVGELLTRAVLIMRGEDEG